MYLLLFFSLGTQAAEMKQVLQSIFTGMTYEEMCAKVDHHTKNMIEFIQPG